MAVSTQNELIGAGRLFAALIDPATMKLKSGYRYLGNSPSLGVNQTKNKVVLYDADKGGMRTIRRSAQISAEMTLNFELTNFDDDNVAFIFGTEAPITVTQAAITGQTQTIESIETDRWYVLGESEDLPTGIRNATSIVPTVGSLTAEEDLDYKVDLAKGKIMFLTEAMAGQNASVSYSASAATFTRIVPGNKPVNVAIRFESDNTIGDDHIWKWSYVELSSDGELALKGEDFARASFTGTVMTPDDGPMMTRDGYPVNL